VRCFSQELLPEILFDLPEVCGLPGEGGAMHVQEVRKEVGIVPPEVGQELRILVYPQKLADNFNGEMVSTSESHSVVVGPRALRRPKSAMRSSMRQKTLTMKVPRSTRAETPFLLRLVWHHRA
jgi:hypothetical protein